jgi:membrane protease YdiL (CAAX protease family)
VAVAVIFEGGMGLLALVMGWLLSCPPADTIRWEPLGVGIGVAASLPLVAILVLITRFPAGPFARLHQVVTTEIVPIFDGCNILDFAMISLLAGVGEELLFRGVLQNALGQWLSPAVGLVLASLLFGLAHPITTAYAVLATLFGLYLGGLWLWTGNLLVPIAAHAVYDFLALVYLVRLAK